MEILFLFILATAILTFLSAVAFTAFLGLIIGVLALILGCAAFFFFKPNNFHTNIPSRAFVSQNFLLSAKNAFAPLQRILGVDYSLSRELSSIRVSNIGPRLLYVRNLVQTYPDRLGNFRICQDISSRGILRDYLDQVRIFDFVHRYREFENRRLRFIRQISK